MKKLITLLALAFCLNAKAQIITTVCGNGTGACAGDGGQATNAELYYPMGLTFDALGNLYIADDQNYRIRKINTSGIISTFAGTGSFGYYGDGSNAISAGLQNPEGLAFDAAGNLYIADYSSARIRKVNTLGIISTVAGNGTQGFSGDGGAATAAELNNPARVAFDAAGNLYIADEYNNRIRMVNTSGIISTVAGSTGGYSGDGGQATAAKLSYPTGIAFDAAGNLYISNGDCIRKVNAAGIISTYAGNGTGGYSGDGGQATVAQLNGSDGITFDAAGNLYIADGNNFRIRKVTNAGIITTIAGGNTQGFSGDNGLATSAELTGPLAVALDAHGGLYIADYSNMRIRKISNVGQAAGIEQFANKEEQINIYPNPAATSFMVSYTGSIKEITLVNVLGNEVLNTTQTNIDVSGLANGVYFINLNTSEGLLTKKLIVQR